MRLRHAAPWALAALLSAAYLIWAPNTPDLAAQVFRTDLFVREGFTIWNGQWYAGHYTPGYSVLFPPLAALLSPRIVGALATFASAILFERIARERWGRRAWLGALWFAAATAANLFIGRMTFALGVALGLGAVLAAQRGRRAPAWALAALCSLSSPVAGLFLALAGVAHALAGLRPPRSPAAPGIGLAAAALIPIGVIALLFGDTGYQTFGAATFWPIVLYAAAVLVLVPRAERSLRMAAALYALASLATFVIDTPMGSNAARLGTIFGPPLLACALWARSPRRTLALAAIAPALLYWQATPVWTELDKAGDASVRASYYAPLTRFLTAHREPPGRVEVVPTRTHYEVVYVSPRFALARGWERQLDTRYGGFFYGDWYSRATYRDWLRLLGVRYVALSDAPVDFAARRELEILSQGIAGLRPVWRSAHWRVFEVVRPAPLVSGAATLRRLGPASFSVTALRAGAALVRVHWSPYWKLAAGAGCVQRAPHDLMRLRVRRPGDIRVVMSFALGRILHHGPRCRH